MRKSVAAFLMLIAGSALAGEKEISESEVPKAVLDSVAKKYPAAKRTGFAREVDKGKTVFEVQLVDGGHKIDVDVSPEGTILETEEELAFDAAPPAVKAALARSAKYAKWTVKRAERVVTAGNDAEPRFEIAVANGKDKAELVFSADGKLVRTE
jgi:hypothetical protein